MNVKLTLTLEKNLVERSKLYAKKTGISLSDLIENYLDAITHEQATDVMPPKLQKIIGAVKLSDHFDEEKELLAYLERKHL